MPQKNGELLPDYGRCYFGHVVAEYKTTKLDQPLSPGIQETLNRYSTNPDSMTWADLYVIEKAILGAQPFTAIKRRAWSLRDKYREVAGPLEYNAYIASHPPNENEEGINPDEVRADLERVLGALHWNYSLIPLREGLRGAIINRIGLWILVSGLILAFLAWRFWEYSFSFLILVAFAGCLGGFVSMQRRIGQVPGDGDPLLSIFQLNSGASTLYLAPVSGAVFALLLFLIFTGGLLKGSLFPDLEKFPKLGWSIKEWTGKEAAVQLGILLVWSFIAGFAERFVPDILDRLVTRGQDSTQPTPSPAPPFSGQRPSSHTDGSASNSSPGKNAGTNGSPGEKDTGAKASEVGGSPNDKDRGNPG